MGGRFTKRGGSCGRLRYIYIISGVDTSTSFITRELARTDRKIEIYKNYWIPRPNRKEDNFEVETTR